MSGRHSNRIVHHHHDDDKSFRGVVEEHGVERGWTDTNTGGYRPNANSIVERRVGMLNQVFRCLLLVATGGRLYYEQLWGPGLIHANEIVNERPWPNRDSPVESLSGKPVMKAKSGHVFGEYVIYKVSNDQKSGKWQPNSEMGIWLGHSKNVYKGHIVGPIGWNADNKCWDIGESVVATTVKVYDNIFPLRMVPNSGADKFEFSELEFDKFVEHTFEPLLTDNNVLGSELAAKEVQTGEVLTGDDLVKSKMTAEESEVDSSYDSSDSQMYEVEKVVAKKVVSGVVSYKVKWKGYSNKHNVWRQVSELNCDGLIEQYESKVNKDKVAHKGKAVRKSKRLLAKDAYGLMAYMVTTAASSCEWVSEGLKLPGDDVVEAVKYLHWKQGLEGSPMEYITGYNKEIDQMLRRRLRLVTDHTERQDIIDNYPVVPLRPQLEPKKDGRRKMRLLLLGYREPDEWDNEPNASPVAKMSTIRSLIFRSGDADEVLSQIDVSCAFLQADLYAADDTPRYVSLRAYRGAPKHIFQQLGPQYGQRSAPRKWFQTLSGWLVDTGFTQAANDPCLFTHTTGLQVVLWVDDLLVRGNVSDSVEFYNSLGAKFDCTDPEFLEPGGCMTFTGIDISRQAEDDEDWYYLSQASEIQELLDDLNTLEVQSRESSLKSFVLKHLV